MDVPTTAAIPIGEQGGKAAQASVQQLPIATYIEIGFLLAGEPASGRSSAVALLRTATAGPLWAARTDSPRYFP
ncbi:hypothetical protein J2S89_000503 [Arthrobacter bambusae]|nr:hypothetical protein [Arthrobacter bambusae]MDQ0096511.1 hypothetical protein [Arthrobacter bambusae]